MLVVVLILGIASAINACRNSLSRDDLDAQSAARAVMADLLYAQNRAIATQKNQYVVFNSIHTELQPLLRRRVRPDHAPDPSGESQQRYTMTFGQTGPNNISSDVTLGAVSFGGQYTVAFDEMREHPIPLTPAQPPTESTRQPSFSTAAPSP